MVRCGFCDTRLGDSAEFEFDDIETVPLGEYVDAWVCPSCEAILGLGELPGDSEASSEDR